MIIRNSMHSITRSPAKSLLFFLLITVISAALTLGTALFVMCNLMQSECDNSYYTTAIIEYRGGLYPDRAVFDETALELHESIDFDALEKLDFVLKSDKEKTLVMSFPGLNRSTIDGKQAGRAVVIKAQVLWNGTQAKTQQVLYSESIHEGTIVPLFYSGPDEYPFVPGRTYIITGYTNENTYGVIPVNVTSIQNRISLESGEDVVLPYLDVTEYEDISLENHPELKYYYEAAASYELISRSCYCKVSSDPSFLEPFSEKEYAITRGHLYTKEETEQSVCCVLPDMIGLRMGLEVGDKVDIIVSTKGSCDLADSYWVTTGEELKTISCQITGFTTSVGNSTPLIYISDIEEKEDCGFSGYTLGTLLLKNGISAEEKEEIKNILGDDVSVTFHDQGYASVTEALSKLRASAITVTLICVIACGATLFLFAFLFIGKQREALETMYMMGTSKRQIRIYVLTGSGLLLVLSSLLGCSLSLLGSDLLNGIIANSMNSATSVLNYYSNGSLGVVKIISGNIHIPIWTGIVIFLSVSVTGIVFCLLFAHKIMSGIGKKRPEKKKKEKKVSAQKSAVTPNINGAGKKYLFISIVRGGLRTASVPLICAVMSLLVLIPTVALRQYRERLDELGRETKITAFFTDYSGKARYDLVLPYSMTNIIESSEYFENFHYCQTDHYLIIASTGGYSYSDSMNVGSPFNETSEMNMPLRPRIVYAEDIKYTPDFSEKNEYLIDWLSGYDDSFFKKESSMAKSIADAGYLSPGTFLYSGTDLREMGVVVSTRFAEKYKAGLGEKIDLIVSEDLILETYTVVGIVDDDGIGETIFSRFENSLKLMPTEFENENVFYLRIRNTASCGYFELADTMKIKEAKEWLLENGFSKVHSSGFIRLYPVLEDAEYCDSSEKIEKNIVYLSAILPAVCALVFIAGITLSWLTMYKRRTEIAVLRSIGERGGRVFLIFFAEQALLSFAGTFITIGIFAAVTRLITYYSLALGFFAGYILGSALSLAKLSKSNLHAILSEKE